jgi:hypothetical protein
MACLDGAEAPVQPLRPFQTLSFISSRGDVWQAAHT